MTCKGICIRYKAITMKNKRYHGRYLDGQSRCDVCDIYIRWDGNSCPCCHYKIRKNPRRRKEVTKLNLIRI